MATTLREAAVTISASMLDKSSPLYGTWIATS